MDFNAVGSSFSWWDDLAVDPAYFKLKDGEPYVDGDCYVTRSDSWLLFNKPCAEEHAIACQWEPPVEQCKQHT